MSWRVWGSSSLICPSDWTSNDLAISFFQVPMWAEGFLTMRQVQPSRFLLRSSAGLAHGSESRFATLQNRDAQVGIRMQPTDRSMHRQASGGTMA